MAKDEKSRPYRHSHADLCCDEGPGLHMAGSKLPGKGAKHGHKGPHGDFDKGPKFRGKMDFAAMDSLLQVTPEQKATLEASRAKGDSIFKELRKQKHEAEKALGEALESKDSAGIDAAKAKVLDADKALLEHRINGMQALAGILTAEQLEKFNAFHKERTKAFKERFKNGPHHGPHGNPPAAN